MNKILKNILSATLACIALTACSAQDTISTDLPGYYIEFPRATDDNIALKAEWVYDLKALSKQMTVTHAPVYFEPRPADFNFVKQFGIDIEEYETNSDGARRYTNGKVVLGEQQGSAIDYRDNYGSFSAHFEEAVEGKPLNDEEAAQVAMDFLVSHGLWNDAFDPKPAINRPFSTSADGTVTEHDEVYLDYYRKPNEYGNIYGASRIIIRIGATGSVKSLTYTYREYTKTEEVELIPVEEALKSARKNGNVLWNFQNPPTKLTFENVTLRYYVEENNPDNLAMQPIYIFSGTSTQKNGETEKFGMYVQANRVPRNN